MDMDGLDRHCESCGDDGSLYLHSRCHPDKPTWAVLSGDVLTVECAECEAVIVRFHISGIVNEEIGDGGRG